MTETTEKYDSSKIERIRRKLEKSASSGKSEYFEIFVDNLKVVPRTNDLEKFDDYEEFIEDDSKIIAILVYGTSATTPRNIRYNFLLKSNEEVQPAIPVMSGIEIDARINEKIATERERWETELLKKDLISTKEQLEEAEEYIEKLQDTIETMKAEGVKKAMGWAEMASVAFEGIVRRNTHLIAKFPGGEALAGIIDMDNKERLLPAAQTESEVSFKKKSDAEPTETSEEDKQYLSIVRQMEEFFNQEQLNTVMQIVQHLTQNTDDITTVAQLLLKR